MADFDPYSALLADEPTALEMAKARAAALRGQNYAGMVMGLAHDPQAAKMGGELMQQAQAGQTQLGELPGQRMQRMLHQQALEKQQFELGGLQSPEYGSAGQALLKTFGLTVPSTTPNAAVQQILPIAEKGFGASEQAKYRQMLASQNWVPFTNSDTGETYLINHRTGQIRGMDSAPPPSPAATGPGPAPAVKPGQPGLGPGPVAPAATPSVTPSVAPGQPPLPPSKPLGKLGNKLLTQLKTDLDPSQSRGGLMKENQGRLNAANRLLTLAVDPLTGGPADLTPQQMSEVSSSLATLIGGGGSSEGSRHELTPYSKGRSMAEIAQWITDTPHGADQQAFVKQMIDTAKREQETAAQAIRTAQGQRLSSNILALRRYPKESLEILQDYGFDPAEVDMTTGRYTPKAKAAAAAPAANNLRKKYGL